MNEGSSEIAVVGDLHSHWDERDVRYFDESGYRAVFVTGDLGGSGARNGVNIARSLSRIRKPLFVMPGNNDAEEYARITAELTYQAGRRGLLADSPSSQLKVQRTLATICGYSSHLLALETFAVTLIATRPFAMGGDELSFARVLALAFGVRSIEESTERLLQIVDQAETEHLVFLGHNGPRGLGESPNSPFGRDFDPAAGDFGDSDFERAICHARDRGRRVLAVVAGHMHSPTRDGTPREWRSERDGVLYVNAARVPRHLPGKGGSRRHHVALRLSENGAAAREVWVEE